MSGQAEPRWSPILDSLPKVAIPSPCWAKRPDGLEHCTEPPGHKHRHYDWSTGREWTNTGNDPQW